MTGYLVRLRYPFRLQEDRPISLPRLAQAYVRFFINRSDAECFAHEMLPLWHNPLGAGAQINIYGKLTTHHNMERDEESQHFLHHIPLTELCRRSYAAGIEPLAEADWYDQGNWQAWWELMTEPMPWPEQARLRRHLGVLPWVPNPFSYQIAWLDNKALCFQPFLHEYDMGWVIAGFSELGLSPPGTARPLQDWETRWPLESWQKWWDETNEALPEETRDLAWWLLMPYPYQIVEVELEE